MSRSVNNMSKGLSLLSVKETISKNSTKRKIKS